MKYGTKPLSPNALLAILTGLNLFNYLDRQILSSVVEPLKAELQLTDTQMGQIPTFFMIGYMLTSPFFGYLGDRMSRKHLIAGGIFVWSLATVMTGFVHGFLALLFWRVLVGVGEASYASISPSLISDSFAPAKRNNALTIFYVAIPVGSALGYVLGGLISAQWGWRDAFFWAGLPGLVLAFLLQPYREPERGSSEGASAMAAARVLPSFKDVLGLLRLKDYALVVWGYAAYTFVLGAYAYWGPAFLERVHGMSTGQAGTFFGAVLVVAGLVGTFLGGFWATRVQQKFVAGYSLISAVSVLLAIPATVYAFTTTSLTGVLASFAVAIFLLFVSTGPINTLVLETVPLNVRSSAMAMSIFVSHAAGDLWSPPLVGWLSDRWGDLARALMILPLALLVCGAFWLWVSKRQVRYQKIAPSL